MTMIAPAAAMRLRAPTPCAVAAPLLIAAHGAALAAFDRIGELEELANCPPGSSSDWPAATAALDAARDALFAHRPSSHDEVQLKLAYFAACRCFTDWDDFEPEDMLRSLQLAPGGAH